MLMLLLIEMTSCKPRPLTCNVSSTVEVPDAFGMTASVTTALSETASSFSSPAALSVASDAQQQSQGQHAAREDGGPHRFLPRAQHSVPGHLQHPHGRTSISGEI